MLHNKNVCFDSSIYFVIFIKVIKIYKMKKIILLLLVFPLFALSSLTNIKIKNNTQTKMRFEVYNKGNMMETNGIVNGGQEASVYVNAASNYIYVIYCPAYNYSCPGNAPQASSDGYTTYTLN